MAKSGSVKLSGRFKPGTEVVLKESPTGDDRALRAGDGPVLDTQTVDKDGTLTFSKGVEQGGKYFACGYVDGTYLEVRLTGRAADDVNSEIAQPPVQPDRVRLSDGSFLDEPPEQHQKQPEHEVGPHLGQHQVPKGVVQRSDTPRGSAHPVDPAEQAPVRRQEDVPDGVVQMSSTETGQATEIVQSVQRQEDATGLLQRSDTPHGRAVPIPKGDAVEAQLLKESSAGKESRGEPGKAAAEPLGGEVKVKGAKAAGNAPSVGGAPNDRDVTSGHDAMGQPVYPDLARNVGVDPAAKPVEGKGARKADAPEALPESLERLNEPPQDLKKSETEDATTGAGQAEPSGETDVTRGKASRGGSTSSSSKSAGSSGSGSKSTKAKEK